MKGSQSIDNLVSNNSVGSVDISSPLYMHPSDNLGASLVKVNFDGVGYNSGKQGVLRVMSVKNKLGCINGYSKQLDPGTSLFPLWVRCDDIVTS